MNRLLFANESDANNDEDNESQPLLATGNLSYPLTIHNIIDKDKDRDLSNIMHG